MRINKSAIAELEVPLSGERTYQDDHLKGFGVRVRASGTRTFVADGWIAGKGKRCRYSIGKLGKTTPEAARKIARWALDEMASGRDPNEQKRDVRKAEAEKKTASKTLGEIWREYKAVKRLNERTTVRTNESVLRRGFSDWLEKPIIEITMEKALERYQVMSCKVGPRSSADGAKAEAEKGIKLIQGLCEYAMSRYEIFVSNPVKRAMTVAGAGRHKSRRRQIVIEDHKLGEWYRAAQRLPHDTTRDYLLLLLFTGLRVTETAGLVWSEIDFDARTLTIPPSRAKNKKEHRLPLSDYVFNLLDHRFKVNQSNVIPSIYVFPGDGASGHLVEPKRAVAFVVEKSGIKFSCHDLRRTFITVSERLAIPHNTHKMLLNHSQSSDVTSGYIVVNVEDMRKPMQQITNHLKEYMGVDGTREQNES